MKKPRIGVFGAHRGMAMIKMLLGYPNAELVAVCDKFVPLLDQVKQKCYMDVSEKGTEAAAVTSVQIRLTSARPVQKLPVMRVDRPFFFVIADGANEKVLFAGKIANL